MILLLTACFRSNQDPDDFSKTSDTTTSSSSSAGATGILNFAEYYSYGQASTRKYALDDGYTFPTDISDAVREIAQYLYEEFDMDRENLLLSAKILEKCGVKKIIDLKSKISPWGSLWVDIQCDDGKAYYFTMNVFGVLGQVRKDNEFGEIIGGTVK